MSALHCPRCGSSEVECKHDPHVHHCESCGYDGTAIARAALAPSDEEPGT